MSDFVQWHLEQVERRLRSLMGEYLRLQATQFRSTPCWTPAVNVYRCPDRLVVCVDLAGVKPRDLSVRAEPRRLRIRGHRAPPEPASPAAEPVQVLAMEIDAGAFERDLRLPEEIDPERTTAEQRDGWLWIQLPLKTTP